ncbi:MAG TPA: hypothetical protein VMM18_00160, partial [Gemmatimonadaceae bacterium]|nr:hypothetical protein [Gemmatimonadaceae bacterium]
MTHFSHERDRDAASALVTPPAAFPAAAVIRAMPANWSPAIEPDPWQLRPGRGPMTWRAWLLVTGIWTMFGIFSANQSMLFNALRGEDVPGADTYAITL